MKRQLLIIMIIALALPLSSHALTEMEKTIFPSLQVEGEQRGDEEKEDLMSILENDTEMDIIFKVKNDIETDYPGSLVFEDLLGLSSKLFKVETVSESFEAPIVALILSETNLSFEHNGLTSMVDAIVKTDDGMYYNITPAVSWTTNDMRVSTVYSGQIRSSGKGSALITAEYGGYSESLEVLVMDEFDLDQLAEQLINQYYAEQVRPGTMATRMMPQAEVNDVFKRAKAMINYKWTPSSDLVGWKADKTFKAGETVTGLPYTQTPNQLNEISFAQKLTAKDFYSTYSDGAGRAMPRYGNDCSGFFQYAWGTLTTNSSMANKLNTYQIQDKVSDNTWPKLGNYNVAFPKANDLKNAYAVLKPGDGLVSTEEGHIRLVVSVDNTAKTIWVYEQTPPQATMNLYSFDTLANATYRPFTKTPMLGWYSYGGSWYYSNNGFIATGWHKINNVWYYFNPSDSNKMVSSKFLKVDGKTYYFRADGSMHIGWWQSGVNWYYLGGDGTRYENKWLQENGAWYWLKSTGVMAKNEYVTVSGVKYYFNASGVWQK